MRADRLERLAQAAHRRHQKAEKGQGFSADEELLALAENEPRVLKAALSSLGFQSETRDDELRFRRRRQQRRRPPSHDGEQKRGEASQRARKQRPAAPPTAPSDSPFAVLQLLKTGSRFSR